MNMVCLSENTNILLKDYLRSKGCGLIEIRNTDAVYDAICAHTDIYLCKIQDALIVAPEQLPLIREALLRCGSEFIPGASALGFRYPENICYNAVQAGRFLIHNTKHTAPEILQQASAAGLEVIHVRQGYTKCNLVVVDENSVITSDEGLAGTLEQNGMDVLRILPGHVNLPGLNYGFLGGASGRVDNELLFNGNLEKHPEFEKIREFISRKGLKTVWFPTYPLEDIGSIIQL